MADTGEILAASLEALNAHDEDRIRSTYADDVVFEAPGDVRLEGADATTEYAMAWLRAFPDARITPRNEVVSGEWAVAEYAFDGTHEETLVGPAGEVPATGRTVSARGVLTFRIVDGKIVEEHLYFDQVQVMTQLGLMPEPATA